MKLRAYQQEAVEAVFAYWCRAPSTTSKPASPLVVMPTGSGKSVVLGETVRKLVQEYGARVLVATHRAELIKQDAKAIRSVWPMAPIGIYSAGLNRKELGHEITVGGVQSLCRVTKRLGHVDVLIVDEAHLVPATSSEQYGKLIAALRETNPDMRLLGYTATPFRSGQGYLTEGDGAVFTSIAYDVPMKRLIDEGHLSTMTTGYATAKIDTSNVSITAGEYNLRQLGEVSDTDKINDAVASDVAGGLSKGRTSAIVFATNVDHAARLRNALRMLGVSTELVTGETPQEQREEIYTRFKARKLQAITSCDVLTTGFDAPVVDIVAIVRATLAPSLFVQMGGRGTRVAEGKVGCLLLDYGGNLDRHGHIDAPIVKSKKKGSGEAPVKTCDKCLAQCAAGCRACPHCGEEFPEPEKKQMDDRASSKAALSFQAVKEPPKRHRVGNVEWCKHQKRDDPDAPPTLRLDYYSPEDGPMSVPRKIASQWICIEHEEGGYAWKKAMQWWADNVGCREPVSVDDAIALLEAGYMADVVEIETEKDKKNPKYDVVTQVRQRRPEPRDDADEEAPLPTPTLLETAVGFDEDEIPF
jgi:DNA repair protein RadD